MLDIIVPVSPRINGCPEKPGAPHLLLLIVGAGWAILGLGNIVMMPWAEGGGVLTFGVIFNMVLFILPGLILAGIGSALRKRSSRA
jgi:hypothetical protein